MHSAPTYRLGLVGHAGRMGQHVLHALAEAPGAAKLTSLLVHHTPAPEALQHLQQTDASAFVHHVDVVLDFSAPTACARLAPLCAAQRKAYLVASTALGSEDEAALAAAAANTAVLVAANLSLGINVLLELVARAAELLGDSDVEILELHHGRKRDAPSGTALALGQAASTGRHRAGQMLTPVWARAGAEAPRQSGELGYGALRGGDVAGEHTVYLLGDGERLELTHRASRADIFARGALRACAFLAQAKAGRYSMQDVMSASKA